MKMIFFGPPGTGKGTYASRIGPKLNIPHISTGDIFRAAVKNQTELGKRVENLLQEGKFVDDDTVNGIIKERLSQEDAQNGFILDGYPRTTKQADFLADMAGVDLVLNIVLAEDLIMQKALARRSCPNCNKIYNVADIKIGDIHLPPLAPREEGKCDECGSEIVQRKDDNEETIRDRLNTYKEQSRPLIDYYTEKGLIKDVNVIGPPDKMVPIIMEIIGQGK